MIMLMDEKKKVDTIISHGEMVKMLNCNKYVTEYQNE